MSGIFDGGSIGDRAVIITRHAQERILDMALDPSEVRDAIWHPEERWVSTKYGLPNQRAGRVAVALRGESDGSVTVVTVLWGTESAWRADAAQLPPARGREFRPDLRLGGSGHQ